MLIKTYQKNQNYLLGLIETMFNEFLCPKCAIKCSKTQITTRPFKCK